MQDAPRRDVRAARVGGGPLARAAALAATLAVVLALAVPQVQAQTTTWERLPAIPIQGYSDAINAIDFFEGPTPADDSLFAFMDYGPFLYNPSGAAGPAGDNAEFHPWHRLCHPSNTRCGSARDGVIAVSETVMFTHFSVQRSTNRGRTWESVTDSRIPMFESTIPGLRAPDGTPAVFAGAGAYGELQVSYADGAAGSWELLDVEPGTPMVLGEVPPSPALPNGRLLYGVFSGALYSDDGGHTFTPSNVYEFKRYLTNSFAFLPEAGHPYGGVVYVGISDLYLPHPESQALLMRSDDGGATYSLVYRFLAQELAWPPWPNGPPYGTRSDAPPSDIILYAAADGALWAGVGSSKYGGPPWVGRIMRSTDGGVTWARADTGYAYDDPHGVGYRVQQFTLARDGRLYAATGRGIWRTTAPIVSASALPTAASGVTLAVRPNPAAASAALTVTAQTGGEARVTVVDVQGREVARVYAGPMLAGMTPLSVDVSGLAPGVYVVRADVGGDVRTARLVVAR